MKRWGTTGAAEPVVPQLPQRAAATLRSLGTQRLLAVFAAGWLLLNFPLLALWSADVQVFGLPLFPLALFGIWAALIVATAWLVERLPD